MMLALSPLLAALVLAAADPKPADPKPACTPFDAVTAKLAQKYHEKPAAVGMSDDLSVVFFLSPAGTWTMLSVGPDGCVEMIAVGRDWTPFKPGEPA